MLILVYIHVKTQVTTSLKDLLNKLFQLVDSLGAQHTEPLCGWCSGMLENEDTLCWKRRSACMRIRENHEEEYACY